MSLKPDIFVVVLFSADANPIGKGADILLRSHNGKGLNAGNWVIGAVFPVQLVIP